MAGLLEQSPTSGEYFLALFPFALSFSFSLLAGVL
jgi:hypothetical protein